MKSIKQFLAIAIVAITSISFAQKSENNLAIKGYDPVAYFQEAKAVKGDKAISAIENGKSYFFSSEANKALFLKNPETYEPQYGGYCAFGMSDRKSTRLNSSHRNTSRMPSSA